MSDILWQFSQYYRKLNQNRPIILSVSKVFLSRRTKAY